MTIRRVYRISEKCRITDKGPEITREYRFGEDAVSDDAYGFLAGPYTSQGYPVLGEQYAPDVEIYVDDVQAQRTGEDKEYCAEASDSNQTLHVWKVTVKYSGLELNENHFEDTEIFDVSIFGESVDMDGRYDCGDGVNDPKANKNSAGEFFEDKLPMQSPVIVVRLSVKSVSPPDVDLHRKVNSGTWWGGAATTWLCRNVSGEYVHNEKEAYWKNTYEFAYNAENWQLKKADSGYYHYEQATGGSERVRNINEDGSENIRPVLLDGSGGILPEGSEPEYICFDVYQRCAFPASLPCPLGWT